MINPSWYPTDRQLRQFSVTSLVGFGAAGLIVWLQLGLDMVTIVLWTFGGLIFVMGMLRPRLVLTVYLGLMGLAFPIGWLVTNVFLRVLFYGLITPLGLIFQLWGRDPLKLKKRDTESYWLVKEQGTDVENYYRQA